MVRAINDFWPGLVVTRLTVIADTDTLFVVVAVKEKDELNRWTNIFVKTCGGSYDGQYVYITLATSRRRNYVLSTLAKRDMYWLRLSRTRYCLVLGYPNPRSFHVQAFDKTNMYPDGNMPINMCEKLYACLFVFVFPSCFQSFYIVPNILLTFQ